MPVNDLTEIIEECGELIANLRSFNSGFAIGRGQNEESSLYNTFKVLDSFPTTLGNIKTKLKELEKEKNENEKTI